MKKIFVTSFFALMTMVSQAQVWNQVNVPTTENLLDIEFPPGTTSVGYIGGENGTLLKTTDGGLNWSQVSYSGINAGVNFHFEDLEFANDNVGYATLSGTIGLYKTMDGGSTWTVMDDMNIGAFCFRHSLHVFDENHFIAGGAGCFQSAMLVEYNNGVWSEKVDQHENYDPSHFVRDIDFRGNLGIATVNDHLFLRSTDAGQTWDTIVSPIASPNNHLTDVIIVNDTLVFAGHQEYSGQYLFFQSNDGGVTWWNAQPTGGDLIYYASWYAFEQSDDGDIYASASQLGGPHYMQTRTNAIWSHEEVEREIYSIDSYGNDLAFGVGDSGYVIVNSDWMLSLEEKEQEFSVYPNPSTDVVNIELENEVNAIISINDLQGKQLEEREMNGSIQLSVEGWQPGIYLITIDLEEHTRTMRLVKQ